MQSATRLGSGRSLRRHSLMPQPFKHPTTHVYYFRKKVPKGLVGVLACREYKRSLGTKDLAEAKVRFAREAVRCDEAFATARAAVGGVQPITRGVAEGLAERWYVAEQERLHLVGDYIRALKIDAHTLKRPDACEWPDGRFGYEIFNELVVCLRRAMTDEGFIARRRRRRRREQGRRHFISGKTYIHEIFVRYSRLLVLRIDFGYRDWTKAANNLPPASPWTRHVVIWRGSSTTVDPTPSSTTWSDTFGSSKRVRPRGTTST